MWLAPGQEPTEHLLRELLDEDLQGVPLTLLVPDRFAVTVSGKDTTAASLNQRGTPCEHPEAQILLDADLSFGSLEIKYI